MRPDSHTSWSARDRHESSGLRVPERRASGTGGRIEYRRIEAYLSEAKIKVTCIRAKNRTHTITFHRPLQFYVKALGKAGFGVTHLENGFQSSGQRGGSLRRLKKLGRRSLCFLYRSENLTCLCQNRRRRKNCGRSSETIRKNSLASS